MNIKLVVFDLDDTLFPEREFVMSGFMAVDLYLRKTHGVYGFLQSGGELFAAGERGKIFNQALRKLVHKADQKHAVQSLLADEEATVVKLLQVYRSHPPHIHLFADAKAILKELDGKVKMALLTDGYLETQKRKVAALKIAGYFSTMVFSDEYGRSHWKPSPFAYKKCMDLTGMKGPDCLYVADNPAKDFVAAKKLGWTTWQIRRPHAEYSQVAEGDDPAFAAERQIESLESLKALLPGR